MIENKKIMMLATTDNMIGQFLLPHIKYLQEHGNTVECVCARTGFWFDELKDKYGLKVHEIGFKRSPFTPANFKGYRKLVKLQKQEKFDLIYCQQPVGGLMGRLLARKFKLPCIYTAHGFHFFKGNSKLKNFLFKTVEKFLAKYTDILITINQEDYDACKNWKAKHVFKINGIGVDLSKYTTDDNLDKNEFRKSLGLAPDDFVVVSIGELNKNKNTYRLLEAVKQINNDKIKYLVCGQGPLREEYDKFIAENALQDRVKMLGFRKDIPNILSIADLYIMPSYREGLSKSMMESMCYGLPVIASRIRGNTDLLGEQEGGLLCEPDDTNGFKNSIVQIFENEELAKKFGARNLEFIKNFDIDVVLKQLEEIYNFLIEEEII